MIMDLLHKANDLVEAVARDNDQDGGLITRPTMRACDELRQTIALFKKDLERKATTVPAVDQSGFASFPE